jgi:hypothetical protein
MCVKTELDTAYKSQRNYIVVPVQMDSWNCSTVHSSTVEKHGQANEWGCCCYKQRCMSGIGIVRVRVTDKKPRSCVQDNHGTVDMQNDGRLIRLGECGTCANFRQYCKDAALAAISMGQEG